jgi:peptidoglycan hydrolase-like protein with peptidoglycan-binding domain
MTTTGLHVRRRLGAAAAAGALSLAVAACGSGASRSATGTTTTTSATAPTTAPSTVPPTTAAPTTSPTTAPPAASLLHRGDTGAAVRSLQQRLTTLGYWLGAPNGVFGDSTQQAVYALQKVAGLRPTASSDH